GGLGIRHEVRHVDDAGAAAALDADGGDQVEPEERQIGEVVLCERLTAKVRVDQSQAPEAAARGAQTAHVRQHELGGVAYENVLDLSAPVDEDADLARNFRRDLAEERRELGPDDVGGRHPTPVDAFEHLEGCRPQAGYVAGYFLHRIFSDYTFVG